MPSRMYRMPTMIAKNGSPKLNRTIQANMFNKAKFVAQIATIESEEVGKKAALATAQGALTASRSILNGLGYDAALKALQTY